MNTFFAYVATIIPLAVLDAVWLMFVAKGFYSTHMSFLFSKTVNFTPVLFFYPIYAFVVLMLVVMPAVVANSWAEALWRGALLGLASYGAYDLTNHATISGWPLKMTLVDMGWGVVVTALTSAIAYFIITSFK
ncbi:MAG: DUF2177 family protein [Candidatus Pacebacteria bacterium]|nr:DUF2177 family protein [Candidatus Paceibacterota bacterium]